MTDREVLVAHHRFVRDDAEDEKTMASNWGVRLARKYYNKLYKEFAIVDLSNYKVNIGLRWRIESEVISGKGQTKCGEINCNNTNGLCIYEVPFSYVEDNETKIELVKVVMCKSCTQKLKYSTDKSRSQHRKVSKSEYKEYRSRESSSFTGSHDSCATETTRKRPKYN